MLAQSLGVRSKYKSLIWGIIALWGSIVGNSCVPMNSRSCIHSKHCASNALVTASEGSQNLVIVAYGWFINHHRQSVQPNGTSRLQFVSET